MVPRQDTAGPRVPVATYRLQFNDRFTFNNAREIAPYLKALGITDCYASSYLKAVPGSSHGYDVADPTMLNPEIGSEADYWKWIDALQQLGLGHLLDLVPNHMGIAQSANPWWMDVLENGPSSRYARFFDIEWHPVKDELADKLLIPILGDQYGAVLERQELRLVYADGAFSVQYFDERLPIAPDTYALILGPDLEAWISDHANAISAQQADELRSVLTAAGNLPSRSARDPESIAVRAREKEVVKRRLAAVIESSPSLPTFVAHALAASNGRHNEPRSFDRLDQLLGGQSYRLAHWRVASEEINYRRFFDVNQLAALRMEDPEVFEEVHRFALELAERGAATGYRVDHVDGLFAPSDYLNRLQARTGDNGFYVVVEKILATDERLPGDWPVYGTTGYDFAAVVNNLFVDPQQERTFDQIYARFLRERRPPSFHDLAYESKRLILHETMSGDINSLAHQLNRFSERNRHFRDFTLYSLISTLKDVIACFPVYRTYVTGADPVSDADRQHLHQAVDSAKRRAPGVTSLVFDFIERLLLKQTPVNTPQECEERAAFIGKFQQLTSPVTAKAIEDTVFYNYNRLLSLNEVGGDPLRFGLEPDEVHLWMAERRRDWPASLSTTSTHDSKRGEDVRARLNVLSEIPDDWRTTVAQWRAINRRFKRELHGKPVPDANEEYALYQTLLGAWPFAPEEVPAFAGRMKAYVVKALREAKAHTSWLSPDEEYERAVLHFVDALFDPGRPFLQSFVPFQSRIADLGIYNSLAQLLIKITAPGVPDFYQGGELWDLALVDPDNRRPVDYARRRTALESMVAGTVTPQALFEARADGRIKLFVIYRALATRFAERALFGQGEYVPLKASGTRSTHLFAFARTTADRLSVTIVPRLIAGLIPDRRPLGREAWDDTTVDLPQAFAGFSLEDALTGVPVTPSFDEAGGRVAVADVLCDLPVALLVGRPRR